MGLRLLLPLQSWQQRLLPQSCQHRLLRLLVLAMAQALLVEELAMAHLSSRHLVLAMAQGLALAHHLLPQLHSLDRFRQGCPWEPLSVLLDRLSSALASAIHLQFGSQGDL